MTEFNTYVGDIKEWMKTNDIHANNDYVLRLSTYYGSLDATRELIKAGADIHACYDVALRCSAMNGHLEIVRELIKAGADVHANNDSSLYFSALNGHLEVVCELIKASANVHANNDGALRCSITSRYLRVTRELLKYYKYFNKYKYLMPSLCDSRINHYINIMNIIFDLPLDLYDEIARFI